MEDGMDWDTTLNLENHETLIDCGQRLTNDVNQSDDLLLNNSEDDMFFGLDDSNDEKATTENIKKQREKSSELTNKGQNFDSLFSDTDSTLIERFCKENDSNSQDIMLASAKNCQVTTPLKSTVIQPPNAQSTPLCTKVPQNKIAQKILQRLKENAHKTPQSKTRGQHMLESVVNGHSLSILSNKLHLTQDIATQDIGPFYGLPTRVQNLLQKIRGIKTLYDWQDTCLRLDAIKKRKNLIYSLPTSGGKTLVAEILILKEILCRKKDAILVLPFVAIVQEKIQSMAPFAVELDFLVEEYSGSKGRFPPRRRKRRVLFVCTIEKANSLVNSMIESGRLGEIGLVVVDELHMLGEGGRRGAAMECMVTKTMHCSESTQIIGMTATLGNTDEIASFLRAETYKNNFRPVALEEYVKVKDSVYKVHPEKLCQEDQLVFDRMIGFTSKEMAKRDIDHLATLVLEVIPDHSCLLFCPTKKNCENVASMICKLFPKTLLEHKVKEKNGVLQGLRSDSGSICSTLRFTVPYGVAYHHSGLTSDERRTVEDSYKDGVLSVITCTSTLAAGVNLPARRVIIRSPHIGRQVLCRSQYKQMIGRAGRAGIDTKGESFLIISKPQDRKYVPALVSGCVENCISSLVYDKGKGLNDLLLNLIGLKIIKRMADISSFFSKTLFSQQLGLYKKLQDDLGVTGDESRMDLLINKIAMRSFNYLVDKQLVQQIEDENNDAVLIKITRLGMATYKSSVDLDCSDLVYKDLKRGLESLVLENYLHLLYLVTPYDITNTVKLDWLTYMSEMNRLSSTELVAASVIGVPEQYIAQRASGCNPRKRKINDSVVQRFYITMMLHLLFAGKSVWEVAERFNQPRGFLQSLLSNSASFASRVLYFTKELDEFWPYQALLEKLIQTLQYCTTTELIPLMEIPGVKVARAKQFYNKGFKSLADLAGSNPTALCRDIDLLSRKQAQQIIASAKILLKEKIETLQEEVELLKHVVP